MKIGILGFGSMGKTHAYSIANLKYFSELYIGMAIVTFGDLLSLIIYIIFSFAS